MAYSILPGDWASTEAWLTRSFLLLGIVIIGPWVALIAYDLLLYVIRMGLFAQPARGQNQHHEEASNGSLDQYGGRLVSYEAGESRSKGRSHSRSRSRSRSRSTSQGRSQGRRRGRAKFREDDESDG